jgi:hypothetical protein
MFPILIEEEKTIISIYAKKEKYYKIILKEKGFEVKFKNPQHLIQSQILEITDNILEKINKNEEYEYTDNKNNNKIILKDINSEKLIILL